jgi:phosphocarrier protein HPr
MGDDEMPNTGNSKASRRVEVKNPQGLHLRPGEAFTRKANEFASVISIISGDRRVDGKSLLDIATLGAAQGTKLEIEAHGPDAEVAVKVLADILETKSVDELTREP